MIACSGRDDTGPLGKLCYVVCSLINEHYTMYLIIDFGKRNLQISSWGTFQYLILYFVNFAVFTFKHSVTIPGTEILSLTFSSFPKNVYFIMFNSYFILS